jgi:hypothetical protein
MEERAHKPSVSQKQADMMQHAAHDEDYASERGVPPGLAENQHAANVAAGLWGKTQDGPCPKCEPAPDDEPLPF